jgi:hypothetical protein
MQATISTTDAERIPFWSALVTDRRIAPALGLGFTSGMPFLLTYSTQSAWLTDAGVPLATIGLLAWLSNDRERITLSCLQPHPNALAILWRGTCPSHQITRHLLYLRHIVM